MDKIRTALITGANRGIGFAIAEGLVRRGNIRVLLGARDPELGKTAAQKIGAEPVHLDLSDPTGIEDQVKKIVSDFGAIDILVNNAAVLDSTPGSALSPEAFMRSVHVNIAAPFALIRILAPGMRSRGWGRIVNVSSGWGSFSDGMSGPMAYSVSKAALNALTLSFSHELGSSVKINAACPGWVRTRMGGSGASKSAAEGADTPIWLATLPDDGPTGGFFRDRRPIKW
jgi:NAD(P)-dependent dehydrogenase (short-subunit alcohol dehydrogenase family)